MKIAILFFIVGPLYGYIPNRGTPSPQPILKWKTNTIPYKVNDDGRNELGVTATVADSINQWSAATNLTLSQSSSNSGEVENQNDIHFSTSSYYSPSGGTLAVNSSSYYVQTGEIIESDIEINGNYFTDDAGKALELRGTILHEMGHSIGLSHSETWGSTMFYLSASGHETLSSDDKAGGYALYPCGNTGLGKISGKVVDSSSSAVLGVYVQAVSENRGTVAAGAATDDDGNFVIEGLPVGDTYYLYTRPLKRKSSLPVYFSSASTDLCPGGADYRGSFYGSSGYPQGVHLSSASPSAATGNITVGCSLGLPDGYQSAKGSTFYPPPDDGNNNFSNAFVGLFSQSQFEDESKDTISVDLSSYDAGDNDFLEIKLIAQGLYSILEFETSCDTYPSEYSCSSPVDIDNDKIIRTAITGSSVTVDVKPIEYDYYFDSDDNCRSVTEYPSCTTFGDPLHFYLLSFRVVEQQGNSFTPVSSKQFSLAESSYCGGISRSVAGRKDSETSKKSSGGCGSIDLSGGGPGAGGPLSLGLGFFLGAAVLFSRSRCRKYRHPVS